tara:strand:+ start:139 stop:2412 length:2274 start_codon:yes stop_codon:yes gene_type:complete
VDIGDEALDFAGEQTLELERFKAQQEEVELKARLGEDNAELNNFSADVTTREKDKMVRFKSDTAKFLQQKLADLDKEEGVSDTFRFKYKAQLEESAATHTAAVNKTVKDLTTDQHVRDVDAEYETQALNHKTDLPERLRQNKRIFNENLLSLGEKKSKELRQIADNATVLQSSNIFLEQGNTEAARRALEDPLTIGILGLEGRRTQTEKIARVEFQAGVDKKTSEKVKLADNFIDMGAQGLFNIAKKQIEPGTADPNRNTITTTAGIYERDADGKWKLQPGTAPSGPQTEAEKLRDKMTVVVEVLGEENITPEIQKQVLGLTPEKQSVLAEKIALIKGSGLSAERQAELTLTALGKASPSELDKKIANLDKMLEGGILTAAEHKTALIEVNAGKDLRDPNVIAAEVGEASAVEDVSKSKKLEELGFKSQFEVTTAVSDDIREAHLTALGVVAKDGVQIPTPGTEDIILELSTATEKILQEGRATTINAAAFLARNEFKGELPQEITPLVQIDRMIAAADPELNEKFILETRQELETFKNNSTARAELESTQQKLAGLVLKREDFESDLEFENATGVVSGLDDLLGSTLAQIPGLGDLEDENVTKARLIFSLIARDVVRMIALNPRFPVTEQKLIQDIFSGPSVFLSARQARNKTRVMKDILRRRIATIRSSAEITNLNADEGQSLVAEASQLLEIQARMNRFSFDLIDVTSAAGVKKLTPKKFEKYVKSLTPTDIRELPNSIAIAVDKRRRSRKANK